MGWLDGYDGGGHRSSPFASCMTTRLPLYLPRLVFIACVYVYIYVRVRVWVFISLCVCVVPRTRAHRTGG